MLVTRIRLVSGTILPIVVAAACCIVPSWNLSSFLFRVSVLDRGMGIADLATWQLQAVFLPNLVAAAYAALTTRANVRGARGVLWRTAAGNPLRRSTTLNLIMVTPPAAGFAIFWLITTLRFAASYSVTGIGKSLAALILGILAIVCGTAVGQVLGRRLAAPIAVPISIVGMYLIPLVISGISDGQWWQILGTGFGQDIAENDLGQLVGAFGWFAAMALLLLCLYSILDRGSLSARKPLIGAVAVAVLSPLLVLISA